MISKMPRRGRINCVILAVTVVWSMFIFLLYWNSSASCLAEMERLRMAVERKDRFVELLRDKNDELKEKVSKLEEEKRVNLVDRSTQDKLYLVRAREVRLLQPNNATIWQICQRENLDSNFGLDGWKWKWNRERRARLTVCRSDSVAYSEAKRARGHDLARLRQTNWNSERLKLPSNAWASVNLFKT